MNVRFDELLRRYPDLPVIAEAWMSILEFKTQHDKIADIWK